MPIGRHFPRRGACKHLYRPPLLSVQMMIVARSSQVHKINCLSRHKMAEEYKPMADQETADIDLEIKKIRAEELGYILAGIPLNASHGERIVAMHQQKEFKDPIARFRTPWQASSSASGASFSYSHSPGQVPADQGKSNSVALMKVTRLPPKII